MHELVITEAVFAAREDTEYPIRLHVSGSGFAHVANQVAAAVGDTPVEWIVHSPGASGFSGLLGAVPADGARLRVGWRGSPLVDTDVTFTGVSDV